MTFSTPSRWVFSLTPFLFLLWSVSGGAALEPNDVREALPKKTESYLKEGLVTGGDRQIQSGLIKNIRRASNGGYERIVIDIESEKAPYYQVSVEPLNHRMITTIFGGPRLGLDAKKVVDAFRKSLVVSRVELFPKVEEDSWTFALYLKSSTPVEIFELSAPTRIIFDLKSGPATAQLVKKHPHSVNHRKSAPVKNYTPASHPPVDLAPAEEVPE